MQKLISLPLRSETFKKLHDVQIPQKDLVRRALWVYALALVIMAISFHGRR